jgi:transcription antitermination factor NusG
MAASTEFLGSIGSTATPAWSGPVQAEHWYALHTRTRHEKMVEQRLVQRGVQTFLPLITEIHRWSDRKKKIQLPLFGGYLFAKLTPSKVDRLRVLSVEGVFTFVGVRGEGTPIPDSQIEAVRALVDGGLPCSTHPFLKIGQRVRIRSGALDGVEGILTDRAGGSTLVISIDAIQRSLAVRVEGYAVEPV